jgi:hypothetical protein
MCPLRLAAPDDLSAPGRPEERELVFVRSLEKA